MKLDGDDLLPDAGLVTTRAITIAARRRRRSGHGWCRWAAATAAPTHGMGRTAAVYHAHYRHLVRVAALLLRDSAAAQEIVQDSFACLHHASRACPMRMRHWVTCAGP